MYSSARYHYSHGPPDIITLAEHKFGFVRDDLGTLSNHSYQLHLSLSLPKIFKQRKLRTEAMVQEVNLCVSQSSRFPDLDFPVCPISPGFVSFDTTFQGGFMGLKRGEI